MDLMVDGEPLVDGRRASRVTVTPVRGSKSKVMIEKACIFDRVGNSNVWSERRVVHV